MPKLLEQLRSKREEIYAIASKYSVSNIRVFGSVARGEERDDSDVDFLSRNFITFWWNISTFHQK